MSPSCVLMPPPPPREPPPCPKGGAATAPPPPRRPPDYSVAAQMARSRQALRLARAHSHEGVYAGGVEAPLLAADHPEGEEEEEEEEGRSSDSRFGGPPDEPRVLRCFGETD